MKRLKLVEGQSFGRLTVLKNLEIVKNHSSQVEVKCDCGKVLITSASNLISGNKRSCSYSCTRIYNVAEKTVGKVFGYFKVLKFLKVNTHGHMMYLVRCKCGREKQIEGHAFRSGSTKSCGCWNVEVGRKRALDLMGYTAGRLKVIDRVGSREDNQILWLCSCTCGNTLVKTTTQLRHGGVKSCGCLRKEVSKERAIKSNKIIKFGASKSCTLFLDKIEGLYNIEIKRECPFNGRVFDGRFKNILIEVDSLYWHSNNIEIDTLKEQIAKEKGFKLFRFNIECVEEVSRKLVEYKDILDNIFKG